MRNERKTNLKKLAFGATILSLLLLSTQANATYTQNDYRIYTNTDAQTPTDPWPSGTTDLSENQGATGTNGVTTNDILRLRMSVNVTDAAESGDAFKLQYKEGATCSGAGTWTDLGNTSSTTDFRGYANSTPTDGSTLTSTLLTVSDKSETYEETNNSASMPNAINIGEDGEWDWAIENYDATQGSTYCFRMTKSDGTVLNAYSDYPELEITKYTPKSYSWRWYNDANTNPPTDALAAENTEPAGILDQNPMKLRLLIGETSGTSGIDVKFKLQYSTSSTFASDVNDVVEQGSCTTSSKWCYYNGSSDSDNGAITTNRLTDATQSGTHNESGSSASTFDPQKDEKTEFEFTIIPSGATANQTYYFRAYEVGESAVPLATTMTYPSLKMINPTLSVTIGGVSSGTTIDGYTTDFTTTATTIPFGEPTINTEIFGAQKITITTDSHNGYTAYISADGPFQTVANDIFPSIDGTNESPVPFTISHSNGLGTIAYHAEDDSLKDGSTRFADDDTWAALETDAKEVAYTSAGVTSEDHYVLFGLARSAGQTTGTYSMSINYIIVAEY